MPVTVTDENSCTQSNMQQVLPDSVTCEDLDTHAGKVTVVESTSPMKKVASAKRRPRLDILLQANLVTMLEFTQVARLGEVSKDLRRIIKIKPQTLAYWRAMCHSCSIQLTAMG